jgi:hypothetical protein
MYSSEIIRLVRFFYKKHAEKYIKPNKKEKYSKISLIKKLVTFPNTTLRYKQAA